MKKQKILLFGSTSEICKDLIPKFESRGNDIYRFHRSTSNYFNSRDNMHRKKHITLSNKTNIKTQKFDKIFQGWDIAIFFYGDFGEIGKFHKVKYEKWEKSFESNLFIVTKILHRLLFHSNSKKTKSVITFSGSGTNGPADNYSAYTIGKIALIKLTELIDSEYNDVKIATLGPGWYDSKLHSKTLNHKKMSGENYKKTVDNIKITNNKEISDKIYEFIDWFISSKKELVSGRNFSLIHDAWNNKNLNKKLIDKNIYKLRRNNNF